MVAHVGIEQVVGPEYEAVASQREFPTDFQHQAERDVAGRRSFVAVHEFLSQREVGVGGRTAVLPDVAQFSVELERRNLRHVAPSFPEPVPVAVKSAHVACSRGGTEAPLGRRFGGGACAVEQGFVAPHFVNGENL